MRLIMMIAIAVLMLGGGGAGAYFYFVHPAEASTKIPVKNPSSEAKGDDNSAFVQLDPLILPVIDGKGVSQTISMVVVLEVADKKNEDMVKRLIPKLNDAYIQDMYGVLSRKNAMPNGVVEVGMIKSRLNHISQGVLGDGIVKDVLLQVVQQHPV
jgi:flagellar FliL protein